MKRIAAVVVVTCLIVAGAAVAGAGDDPRRSRSSEGAGAEVARNADRQASKALERALSDVVPRTVTWSTKCTTLRCINHRLGKLRNAVNEAQANVANLRACMDMQGMSRLGQSPGGGTVGYLWRDNNVPEEFLTTALDLDGTDPELWALVWIC